MRRLFAIALLTAGCHHKSAEVPVWVATPSSFVRRVTADGILKAKDVIALSAPTEAPGPLKIAWIADDGAMVAKDSVVVRFDPTDFNTQLLAGSEERTVVGNKSSHTEIDSSTTKTNLQRDAHQAEDELEASKRFNFDDAQAFSRYQRIESALDRKLAEDKREHAHNVLGVRETLSRADRDLLAIETRKAELKIRNAERGLHSLEVRAPFEGILVLKRDWHGDVPRVGATMWAGSPIGEIPKLTMMNAEVYVLEADAAGLAIGEKATVLLESDLSVPHSGKVTRIDKLARPRVKGVPVQYFGVTVSLDVTDPVTMKPGSRVRAILEVENRTNVFSMPREALFEKGGRKIVYVRNGSGFRPAEVTIGSSSPGRLVVTRGLNRGDTLALTDPSKNDESGTAREASHP